MNYNLSINLELIRTIYNWLSQNTTLLSTTEIMNRFYKYVDEDFYNKEIANTTEDAVIKQCKDRYDNFVTNSFVEKSVANKLMKSGIPANCLRIDSATKLLPLSVDKYSSSQSVIEYLLFDFIGSKIRNNNFSDILTKKDMETLNHILANIPSEKICFILLIVHYLMKQVHFTYATKYDGYMTFVNMLNNATYDPNNKNAVAVMKELQKIAQAYELNIDDFITYTVKPEKSTLQIVNSPVNISAEQKKKPRRPKMDDFEKVAKQTLAEYNYGIIGDNALLIRESCKLVAEAMGFGGKSFLRKFYTFLDTKAKENAAKKKGETIDIKEAIINDDKKVKDNHYHKFVHRGYINQEFKELLVSYGIPEKCFDKREPMRIPASSKVNSSLQDLRCASNEQEDSNSYNEFTEALKKYLFANNPTVNNILYSASKKIVTEIYESTCYAPNTSEALFDLLAEMELDGTDFKYKDMKKQLEEIAKSYYENELIEKDEDTQNA